MSHLVGVVDIGSNSMRLVIYDGYTRVPYTIFNEKSLCGLGRGLSSSGKIMPERLQAALETLKRFQVVLRRYEVEQTHFIATSALREASNRQEFLRLAEPIVKQKIEIISPEQEAEYAAQGVLSAFPNAHGIVGDLGGGSLELSALYQGELTHTGSVLLGHQRLLEKLVEHRGFLLPFRRHLDETLAEIAWVPQQRFSTLYAVGGAWRELAEAYMKAIDYPLPMVDHFCMTRSLLLEFIHQCYLGAHKNKLDLENDSQISAKLSAYLLKRLVQVCHIDQVYFSAYGVREGIIYNQLRSSQKAEDPLLCSSQYFSAQLHARPENYDDLQAWTFSFFENLSPEKKRLYEAVLLLCDMAIYEARHVRSMNAFERILTLPLTGITHAERIWIALATSIRYSGNLNARYLQDHLDLIEPEASYEALVLGQFLRLSQTLSCRKSGILPHVNLMVRDNQLIVSSASHVDYLYGDRVEKYLSNLARSLRLIPRIDQAGHFSLEHVSQ